MSTAHAAVVIAIARKHTTTRTADTADAAHPSSPPACRGQVRGGLAPGPRQPSSLRRGGGGVHARAPKVRMLEERGREQGRGGRR
jgi:hypothetical protein